MPRVLVVDDVGPSRLEALAIVRSLGFDGEGVPNGEDALELLRTREGTPMAFDAILADQQMAFLPGTALLDVVEEKYPLMRRLLISGYAAPQTRHPFVNKPLNAAELRRTLE